VAKHAEVDLSDLIRNSGNEPALAHRPRAISEPLRLTPSSTRIPANPYVFKPPTPVAARVPKPKAASALPAPKPGPAPLPADVLDAFDDRGQLAPADATGAVGPNALLAASNNEIFILKAERGIFAHLPLDSFWASLAVNGRRPSAFDPRILYDRFENRWILIAGADNPKNADPPVQREVVRTAALLLAVSRDENPLRGWDMYRIDVDDRDEHWIDYPSVGINRKWIVVHGLITRFDETRPSRSYIYVFDKAGLFRDRNANHIRLSPPTEPQIMTPEVNSDNSDSMILAETFEYQAAGGRRDHVLQLHRIHDTNGLPNLETIDPPITVDPSMDWANDPLTELGPQKGASPTQRLSLGDSRIQTVCSHGGTIWCVQTVFLPDAEGDRESPGLSDVQYWQIRPDAPRNERILQFGRLGDSNPPDGPADPIFRAFPSLAVNRNGDVLIGFSRFRGSEYAGAAYAFRRAGDPRNTFRPEVVFKPGQGRYYRTIGNPSRNRWGDYGTSVVDPDGRDLWTLHCFAAERDKQGDHFGAAWVRVRLNRQP
jgi:hypothetical protein